jgi:hypothetical protein
MRSSMIAEVDAVADVTAMASLRLLLEGEIIAAKMRRRTVSNATIKLPVVGLDRADRLAQKSPSHIAFLRVIW